MLARECRGECLSLICNNSQIIQGAGATQTHTHTHKHAELAMPLPTSWDFALSRDVKPKLLFLTLVSGKSSNCHIKIMFQSARVNNIRSWVSLSHSRSRIALVTRSCRVRVALVTR